MATMQLKIYKADNKNEVEKVYTADSYDLMLGTVEDIMQVIDIDKVHDNLAIASMVMRAYPQLKPFIKDVFVGVTDEELKRIKVKELIPTFMQIATAIIESINLTKSGN